MSLHPGVGPVSVGTAAVLLASALVGASLLIGNSAPPVAGGETSALFSATAAPSISGDSPASRDLAIEPSSLDFAIAAGVIAANTDEAISSGASAARPVISATTIPQTTIAQPAAEVALIPPSAVVQAPLSLRDRVLAEIDYPWEQRLTGWRIEFVQERKGYRGITFPEIRLIQIYQRSDLTFAQYVHTTAHEIGHALDVTLLTDDDRMAWNLARGRNANAGWWVSPGATDFSSGAGDWAESFAWSQFGGDGFTSTLGGNPSPQQLVTLYLLLA